MGKLPVLALSVSVVSCLQSLAISPAWCESASVPKSAISIGAPLTSDNLTIFLIRGNDTLKDRNTITLQEGLAQKKVRVLETGDVNNLKIENNSDSVVYIQSGDIVKGGRQDRTMQYDLILPPHSGLVPLPAFCVEHGRWSERPGQGGKAFASSDNGLCQKALKMAARKDGDQGRVWDMVAQSTESLYTKAAASPAHPVAVAFPVQAAGLPAARQLGADNTSGSLELALNNKTVDEAINSQTKKLLHAVDGDPKVIGFAFAVNGRLNSADVYGSNGLFLKMWPKDLKAAVAEALQQKNEKGSAHAGPISADTVRGALLKAEQARIVKRPEANHSTQLIDRDSSDGMLFETDDKNSGALVHKNYLAK